MGFFAQMGAVAVPNAVPVARPMTINRMPAGIQPGGAATVRLSYQSVPQNIRPQLASQTKRTYSSPSLMTQMMAMPVKNGPVAITQVPIFERPILSLRIYDCEYSSKLFPSISTTNVFF